MNFKKINNISGWVVFAIAYITYLLTMEPTASLWDCGEFLAASNKLQVAHSPGAPLFMMLGRMFGMLTSDPTKIAMMINSMSALLSAFTILFLFWSITHFVRKIVIGNNYESTDGTALTKIISAGVVGALAYTFSDTFWFSAVEAEVYATSSFFTAVVFWAALKWEENADSPYADRWLILIFYLMGLSVGVHLLNLLTIPAIIMIYYFKRYKPTFTGSIIAFLVGCVVLAVLQFGIIQYLPIIAAGFELLFTNSLGMPFNTGFFVFVLVLAGIVVILLNFAKSRNKYMLHLATLCFVFATIGYSSYVTVVIRSKAGVSINMTMPDNIMALIPYLQRDQYGSQPILSGPYFTSTPIRGEDGRNIYMQTKQDGKDRYVVIDNRTDIIFDKNYFFPRIWGFNEERHKNFYRRYLNLGKDQEPTFGDNMKFFMGYQMNWMYWRYFMWNYVGRQNDIAGQGETQHGNWISGIKFIDKMLGRGDVDLLPNYLRNNQARNQLYFLPFILGLLGVFYHYKRHKNDFAIVSLFFFFTGIAIQLYINNTPEQPRERDYAYVSTYAFAIWIGFGVVYLADLINRVLKKPALSAQLAGVISLVAVPVLMASEEWDDHDRSLKTIARDHAFNQLSACDSNSIYITYGDNDTYPLWYIQEIEGFRTDVRILNYNLLGTDWQNDQLFEKVNDSDPLPLIWERGCFWGRNLITAYFYEHPNLNPAQFYSAEEVIKYTSNPKNKLQSQRGSKDSLSIIPTRRIFIKVPKDKVLANGLVRTADSSLIPDDIKMFFEKNGSLSRGDLSLLNILAGLAKDGFKRSLYVTDGVPNLGLDKYFKYEGTFRKFVPVEYDEFTQRTGLPHYADIDRSVKLFTDVYQFGKANTDKVYYDEKNRLIFYGYRQKASLLGFTLAVMNRPADALKVLNTFNEKISQRSLPYEMTQYDGPEMFFMMVETYYMCNDKASAQKYVRIAMDALKAELRYLTDVSSSNDDNMYFKQRAARSLDYLGQLLTKYNDTELAKEAWQAIGKQSQAAPPAQQMPVPQPGAGV